MLDFWGVQQNFQKYTPEIFKFSIIPTKKKENQME